MSSTKWKQPTILLISVGTASLGDFIYLIAINLLVFQITGSAAAVAGLWVVGPIVNVLTKFWTGSFIEYRSKRKIMIVTYLARAIFVFCLPFLSSIWLIFLFLILLSVAKSFFGPSSMTYITEMIPKEMRKRFNSIQSLTTSGAFIIGPAVAGFLILLWGIDITLIINSSSFLLSAFFLMLLPEMGAVEKATIPKLSWAQVREDFRVVRNFVKVNHYVAYIYGLFLVTTIFAFAMDAQEVVFTQDVVGLSEMDYSLLISITGIGSITGAILVSVFSHLFSLRYLFALGILFQSVGYVLYAFSWSFLTITIGFIILGFFNSFLNTGIMTFYQNNVPTNLMGRVTSLVQLLQSALQILMVLVVGTMGDIISLRLMIIVLSTAMLLIAFLIGYSALMPAKKTYFREAS
ncbi:MFS transporter [Oceanobacillus iheyensis]|nr:MFS transporter [Oceanobacillus iheyensis]